MRPANRSHRSRPLLLNRASSNGSARRARQSSDRSRSCVPVHGRWCRERKRLREEGREETLETPGREESFQDEDREERVKVEGPCRDQPFEDQKERTALMPKTGHFILHSNVMPK